MMVKIISALFATIFIAILFQVRRNMYCSLRWAADWVLSSTNWRWPWGSARSSPSFRFDRHRSYSESWPVRKTTVTTFLISALFPRSGCRYVLHHAGHRQQRTDQALTMGVTTLSTAALMALGILFVSTLARLLFRPRSSQKNG
ncbi:MAG: hypothetical protein ACLVJ6_02260 [Merdibacter sp.]